MIFQYDYTLKYKLDKSNRILYKKLNKFNNFTLKLFKNYNYFSFIFTNKIFTFFEIANNIYINTNFIIHWNRNKIIINYCIKDILKKNFINIKNLNNLNIKSNNLNKYIYIKNTYNNYVKKYIISKDLNLNIHNRSPFNNKNLNYQKNLTYNPIYKNYIFKYKNLKLYYNLNLENKVDISVGIKLLNILYENKLNTEFDFIVLYSGIVNNIYYFLYNKKLNKHYIITNIKKIESNKLYWIFKNFIFPLVMLENKSSIITSKGNFNVQMLNPYLMLNKIFFNFLWYYPMYESSKLSLFYIYNLITHSLISQYSYYNINIEKMYFNVIVRNLCSKVIITNSGESCFQKNTIFNNNYIHLINICLLKNNHKPILYRPIFLGLTKFTFSESGLLSGGSFQSTLLFLSKSAAIGSSDWLSNLKSNLISSNLIPSGTGWYRYFNI